MNEIFKRPMLAASLLPSNVEHTDANILASMQKLKYPVLVTLKKDGIRAIRLNGSLLSRTLKPIPNKSVRERSLILPGGFDMELWNHRLSYEEIESIVMSREHERSDQIEFHILDWFGIKDGYFNRINKSLRANCTIQPIINRAYNADQLLKLFLEAEYIGAEGICFRTADSPYKQGRSTLKEQYLVKLCRFNTSEAIITGFEEAMCNANSIKRNNVGAMDRSSSIHNLIPKNTLGALICRDLKSNISFKIGTGFDDKTRLEIWKNRDCYYNKIVTYKFKGGGKIKPRSPVFKGFRKEIDIV